MKKSVTLYRIIQNPELMDQVAIVEGGDLPEFKCEEVGSVFNRITFKIIDDKKKTDFIFLHNGLLVYNKKVARHMSSLLEGIGEQIKLNTSDNSELYAANILETFNCLDWEKSEYVEIEGEDELESISKYIFKPERIGPVSIFKLYEIASKEIFALSNWARDDFYKWYMKRNFKGLGFELIADLQVEHTSHRSFLQYRPKL